MRAVVFMLLSSLAGCGGQPALANAPHPDPGIIAGAAAAAAAAATLADPDAAARKPEKREEVEKRPVEVKEHVTKDVLDRLDKSEAQGSASSDAPKATPAAKSARKGPPPKI